MNAQRYKHLSRDRWLDTKPEVLHSDSLDSAGEVIIDAVTYPGGYRDVSPDIDMGNYKRALAHGFHRIVISNTNPNRRFCE